MANGKDDLRLALGWHKHLKTRALRKTLGADGPLSLIALWSYAGENHKDGDLSRLSDDEIEAAAEWPGEPGVFVSALRRIRWLDEKRLHDWLIEQPYIADTEKRVAAARVGGRARAASGARGAAGRFQRNDPANQRPAGDVQQTAGVAGSSEPAPSLLKRERQSAEPLDAVRAAEKTAEPSYKPAPWTEPGYADRVRDERKRGRA